MVRRRISQTGSNRNSFVRVLIFGLAISGALMALAQSANENLVTLNTRTFDLGTDVASMRRDPDFVPMNDIDWLDPLLDADAVLGATVFHLAVMDKSNKSADALWSFDGFFGKDFQYKQNIPERFVIEGYETRSYHQSSFGRLMMIPLDPTADYSVTCDVEPNTDRVMYCGVWASYPPDPLIFLKARLYFPAPWNERRQQFGAIAARMREIAYCLDVTDKSLELLADGTPKLTDCRAGAGM